MAFEVKENPSLTILFEDYRRAAAKAKEESITPFESWMDYLDVALDDLLAAFNLPSKPKS